MAKRKMTRIIVIDDDPTGSQTVHSCLLLTRWDPQTLGLALRDDAPLFFVLSNTRGMDASRAAAVTREICENLLQALEAVAQDGVEIQPIVVSRSDSTLRGHYPVETDVIAEVLGPFDAHFLVPAFFEGGRITRDAIHYLLVDGQPVPVHETEFARDSVFGFTTAYLPDYVAEKTSGRITSEQVEHFSLAELHGDISDRLQSLQDNCCCIVDAEQQSDLDSFARQVLSVTQNGKRFLFRSAASLLTAFADLSPQPVAASAMSCYVRNARAGVILVGSHVDKSTRQLKHLVENTSILPIEIDLDQMMIDDNLLLSDIQKRIGVAQQQDRDVVLYTSRGERQFASKQARLEFGDRVSGFLVRLVQNLPRDIGFLISKGGITSNDTLSQGLALATARVLGQIHPGCSMVICPEDHPAYPQLPVIIFPGNVGGDDALTDVFRILKHGTADSTAGDHSAGLRQSVINS